MVWYNMMWTHGYPSEIPTIVWHSFLQCFGTFRRLHLGRGEDRVFKHPERTGHAGQLIQKAFATTMCEIDESLASNRVRHSRFPPTRVVCGPEEVTRVLLHLNGGRAKSLTRCTCHGWPHISLFTQHEFLPVGMDRSIHAFPQPCTILLGFDACLSYERISETRASLPHVTTSSQPIIRPAWHALSFRKKGRLHQIGSPVVPFKILDLIG